ncbi:hypothetical protein JQ581_30000 [Bradyrhizobium liaoningense]|uniref:hypothetical protein n=1 Tax=Bradyrhizobium liaoningense TaxID=43992 RepID=UPI001BAC1C5A|nr:hypothetical protein [Bradyrhizobium liaoningense]MBR0741173.1 hypothetical protein [Bradyrhizobium liaoningense]
MQLSEDEARELSDFAALAIDRTRNAVMSVVQLIDNGYLCGAILSTVALDLLRGAQVMISDATGLDEKRAMETIVSGLLHKLDLDASEVARLMGECDAHFRKARH